MATQKAIRKSYYTTLQLASILGRLGEFTVDTTKKTIVVFDGETLGGTPLAKESHIHTNASAEADGFMSSEDYTTLYTHTHSNATTGAPGFMSAADKAKLDGISGAGGGGTPIPYTPSNTPNTIVSRDASGNFAAQEITAVKFKGPLQGNADTTTNGLVSTGTYADPAWLTSLAGSKVTAIPDASIAACAWSKLTGTAPNVSVFPNNAGYINANASITGTSAGVLSPGGRETANPTAQTVVFRDAAGRAQIATPVANADIANKQYVDGSVSGGSYMPQQPWYWEYTIPYPVLSVNQTVTWINVSDGPGLISAMFADVGSSYLQSGSFYLAITIDGLSPQNFVLAPGSFPWFPPKSGAGFTYALYGGAFPFHLSYRSTLRVDVVMQDTNWSAGIVLRLGFIHAVKIG